MSANIIPIEKNDPTKKELGEIVNSLQNEKKKLMPKLSDSKINLNNNKENLISLISNSNIYDNNEYNKTLINEMIIENRSLLEKLGEAFKIKILKEKQLNQITINLDSRFNWEREKISSCNNEIYYMNTKLREKDQIIENLKYEIDRYITLDLEFNKEVYLADPKKNNIDVVNEIASTKDIIKKISSIYEMEKKSRDKLDAELSTLQKDYDTLNRNKTGLSTNDNSKKDLRFTSTNLNRACKTLGKSKLDFTSTGNLNCSEILLNSNPKQNHHNYEESLNLNFNNQIFPNLNYSKLSKSTDSIMENNDSDIQLDFPEAENLEEIQNIKFPDKVVMKQSNTFKSYDLPRLDMSRVYQKYHSQSNVHVIKTIKKKETNIQSNNLNKNTQISKKNSLYLKNSNSISLSNKIQILKNEVVQTKDIIRDLENSLEKIKRNFKENKNKQTKIKENLKIADSKIEALKNQIKLFTNKEINDDINLSDSYSSDENDLSMEYSYISI